MEILRRLAEQRGRAVVIVTHDSRVLQYGTRMVRIADGRIQNAPAHPQETEMVEAVAV